MWNLQEWSDLERAIGVQSEDDAIDFKRELPPKGKIRDLAKDVAAMSIGGGVIVIGVDESNGLASAIAPIELKGVPEQVQQVIDANVSPQLATKITVLRKDPADEHGVVVISVPASWSAPHQYEGRFPARSGATTRQLVEREIESLYERRARLREGAQAEVGLANHQVPPGVRMQVAEKTALMRMKVSPVGGARSPLEPYLGPPLQTAVVSAMDPIGSLVSPKFNPKSFDSLTRWSPAGPYGWRAGEFAVDPSPITVLVGAMFRYAGGFSFSVAIDLSMPAVGPDVRCTHEHHWAIETMALLCIGGQFYSSVPEASLLRVELELGGLLDSVSWQASQGLSFHTNAPKVVENQYRAGGVFSARDLAEDPREAARDLLDPFMVAILTEGSDLVGWVKSQDYWNPP
jgi:hypothetical protein